MDTKALAWSFALLIVASSCHKSIEPSEPASTALSGTIWQLERIDSVGGGAVTVEQADTIRLTFDDDRHLSGASHGLCGNTYFGVYALPGGDSLHVDSVSTTKMGCRPKSLYVEYWLLLWKADHYQRLDRQLNISCDQKSRRLVMRQIK